MAAKDFIAKLKLDESGSGSLDLDEVFNEYKVILSNLAAKEQGLFALNVLCMICRNLEKVPSWSAGVDGKALLSLSIDCVRYTRTLGRPDRVKALACIYHIHKHAVRQKSPTPPELILKLSFMPFETEAEQLLKEYHKTYWNILADRLVYFEKIKVENRLHKIKILPKFIEDLQKVIVLYDTTQFCMNILICVVKKLYFLFHDILPKDLNVSYGSIFDSLSKKNDLKGFTKLSDKDVFDVYVKFNECFYVITENLTKIHFRESVLNNVVNTSMSVLSHLPDINHCIRTVYLNSFCVLLSDKPNLTRMEEILNDFSKSCETTEKLGYKKVMYITYPYINQLLRLFIEYFSGNDDKTKWMAVFNESIQENCLKVLSFLMDKSKDCTQLLKCEGCVVKTGLHDALRLSFHSKYFITISISQQIEVTKLLPLYYLITKQQYKILIDLRTKDCNNFDKCFRKYQADIHNIAVLINKTKHYSYSIKLFDLYLSNEITHFKNKNELTNISRALYNKGICEIDNNLYEDALRDAHLSLVFAYPEGLTNEKYMSLVFEIKARELKSKGSDEDIEDDENQDSFQLKTVLDTSKDVVAGGVYGNLKPFFCHLKFSVLLKHEFDMYAKLWPSAVPIAGVWKSLHGLWKKKLPWMTANDKDNTLQSLCDVVLETATVVRTVHSAYYSEIVVSLLDNFKKNPPKTPEMRVVYATLLLLKSEYDLEEASVKYRWKVTDPSANSESPSTRTLAHEYEAMQSALQGVDMWTDIIKRLATIPNTPTLRHSLQITQVFSMLFLHLSLETHGLQLAYICCLLAQHVDDRPSYIRNAGTLLYFATRKTDILDDFVLKGTKYFPALAASKETMESALVFLCDCAMYYIRAKCGGTACHLVQAVQARILQELEKQPESNHLDFAIGRLMEAQASLDQLGGGGGLESTLNETFGLHKHYLTVVNTGVPPWSVRRYRLLSVRLHSSVWSVRCARGAAALQLWRRARATADARLARCAAAANAHAHAAAVNAHATRDAQVRIDNHLKYTLGLQQSTEIQPLKTKTFTPKKDLSNMMHKLSLGQTSPGCYEVPAFNMPPFLKHLDTCQCYACKNPHCLILGCQISGLEASVYFRAMEFDIAKNYYEGTMQSINLAHEKLNLYLKNVQCGSLVLDMVRDMYSEEFKRIQIQIFIEASFFELSQGNDKMADEYVIRIHEILQNGGAVDSFQLNEVLNLQCATAKFRLVAKKPTGNGLEIDLETLTPEKEIPLPMQKTPESKPYNPPKLPNKVISKEELPSNDIIMTKLNFLTEEEEKEEPKKRRSQRNAFKIPAPVTTKLVTETITPRKPMVLITQPTIDSNVENQNVNVTPIPKTPIDTPEQFFTPMSTLKTYKKKRPTQNVVKNLEAEFSTPISGSKFSTPLSGRRRNVKEK